MDYSNKTNVYTQPPITEVHNQPPYNPSPVPVGYYPHPNNQISSTVVITQPQLHVNPSGWMNIPVGIPNCPPGLEYLTLIDQLLVKQKVRLLEVATGYQQNNKFVIKNAMGQNVYFAVEDNDCCTRNCFGSVRPYDMKVMDVYQNEVIHFYRPLACSSCCFPCCLQSIEVTSSGQVIGRVEQEWTLCYPHYSIKNHSGETVLRIEGPLCKFSCGNDVDFNILSLDGTQVGKISKQWSGLARELFTDTDYFGISFPMDLDVRMKAVMLGACMLINSMFYEHDKDFASSNDNVN
ncbi:phospholipid scramblase 1-like [Sitodiplosis mosellana]|uniref:phospholipid scramblase 1-like n=1 Tax=Sitodiplosis mosellana TaxID=263140 RepID=UPI0024444037|nr:phospholipid scramblase 1-like [Sitodiplosis mosellana]XP_055304797.1 phospholipid scramblase 1-like [Sitodiplosis mosellana]